MYSSLRLCSAKIPSNSGERTNGVNEATTNLFLLKVYTQKKTFDTRRYDLCEITAQERSAVALTSNP